MDRHFKVYKPYGFLSQFKNNGPQKRRQQLLGALGAFPESTMAIGRLDEKSEGLLLLTTNGKTSNAICSGNIEKEYHAQVDGDIDERALIALMRGVEIGVKGLRYHTKPCKVFKLDAPPPFPERPKKIRDNRHGPTSWISITLTEGKFRQVRKMTAAVGFPTLRLVRVRIGDNHLSDMKPGEVREVTQLFPESDQCEGDQKKRPPDSDDLSLC